MHSRVTRGTTVHYFILKFDFLKRTEMFKHLIFAEEIHAIKCFKGMSHVVQNGCLLGLFFQWEHYLLGGVRP